MGQRSISHGSVIHIHINELNNILQYSAYTYHYIYYDVVVYIPGIPHRCDIAVFSTIYMGSTGISDPVSFCKDCPERPKIRAPSRYLHTQIKYTYTINRS